MTVARGRIDGALKVTGAVSYPPDASAPGLLHGRIVQSTVPRGVIRSVDTSRALAAPGVVAVYTHLNAPELNRGPDTLLGRATAPALQDDQVHYHGQHVALVVAENLDHAAEAAHLVKLTYEPLPAILGWGDDESVTHPFQDLEPAHGDAPAELADPVVSVTADYETAANIPHPIGLFSTMATWTQGNLTVVESTQWPAMVRDHLAGSLGIESEAVRVLVPHLGGGFGAGLRAWGHTALTAAAARDLGRPLKVVLTRPQMVTLLGHRIRSRHHVALAALPDSEVSAIRQDSLSLSSVVGAPLLPPPSFAGVASYSAANLSRADHLIRANIPEDGAMRAPGTAEGQFALETALDELAHVTGVDPVELRRRNHAQVHPYSGKPWSSNHLLTCLDEGARIIGWADRPRRPRMQKSGRWYIGMGMAAVSFDRYILPSAATTTLRPDGTAIVRASGTDIGNGTYTVIRRLAAQRLDLPETSVDVRLGDSHLPDSAQSGGSALATSLGWAVMKSCNDAIRRRRAQSTDAEVVGEGRVEYNENLDPDLEPAGAFAAKFVEVRVDPALGAGASEPTGDRYRRRETARS